MSQIQSAADQLCNTSRETVGLIGYLAWIQSKGVCKVLCHVVSHRKQPVRHVGNHVLYSWATDFEQYRQ